jgi:hypothetical protein
MLLSPEATKSLKVQVATTLVQAGFSIARISKMNNTAGRRWENCHGGFTFRTIEGTVWHDGSITQSKIRIRRWAESENAFANSRQLSPDAYKACLDSAGFITEVKGKDLFVLGNERVGA